MQKGTLKMQLDSIASVCTRIADEHVHFNETEDNFDREGNNEEIVTCLKSMKRCQNCLSCTFKVIHNYNPNCAAFLVVYSAYHFLLTFAVTQVECERSF